jgi:hypothetical protein
MHLQADDRIETLHGITSWNRVRSWIEWPPPAAGSSQKAGARAVDPREPLRIEPAGYAYSRMPARLAGMV